jgi:two-component system KDP operon response regulator KdpE
MRKESIKVLVVDDEPRIRHALRVALGSLGFEIQDACDGEEAIEIVQGQCPHVVLLDISLPGISGVETCLELRRMCPSAGIVMLTVRDSERSKIEALDAGADDYVCKPFTVGELAARLRAVVRRGRAVVPQNIPLLVSGELEIDAVHRTVRKGGRPIHLTPKEFDLLYVLASRPGVPIRHVDLLRAVWGFKYGGEVEYIRTFVNQLRKKIEDDPGNPTYLLTHPFVGYLFKGQVKEPERETNQDIGSV